MNSKEPNTTQKGRLMDIFDAIEIITGVGEEEVKGRSRKMHVIRARAHAVLAIRRDFSAWSMKEVGRILGDRDHATISNTVNTIIPSLSSDSFFKVEVQEIEKSIASLRQIREGTSLGPEENTTGEGTLVAPIPFKLISADDLLRWFERECSKATREGNHARAFTMSLHGGNIERALKAWKEENL